METLRINVEFQYHELVSGDVGVLCILHEGEGQGKALRVAGRDAPDALIQAAMKWQEANNRAKSRLMGRVTVGNVKLTVHVQERGSKVVSYENKTHTLTDHTGVLISPTEMVITPMTFEELKAQGKLQEIDDG